MKFFHGMTCPVCEIGTLESRKEQLTFQYKGHEMILPEREVFVCPECEESFLDPKDERYVEKLLTDERRKVDGLLTSSEIKAIRKQFHLTQVEFATLLRVSEKSFARYENGQATQGYAMDNLLRILHKYPDTIDAITGKPERHHCDNGHIAYISADDQFFPMRDSEKNVDKGVLKI